MTVRQNTVLYFSMPSTLKCSSTALWLLTTLCQLYFYAVFNAMLCHNYTDELELKTVVTYCKILPHHLPVGTEESHEPCS